MIARITDKRFLRLMLILMLLLCAAIGAFLWSGRQSRNVFMQQCTKDINSADTCHDLAQ